MIGGINFNYWEMLFGRFLFGIGTLSMQVCESVMISVWFFDRGLTMGMGLSFGSCNVGTAITSIVTPYVMDEKGEVRIEEG